MRIKILKDTAISGKHVKAGEVLNVTDQDADVLAQYGKAEKLAAAANPVKPPKPESAQRGK